MPPGPPNPSSTPIARLLRPHERVLASLPCRLKLTHTDRDARSGGTEVAPNKAPRDAEAAIVASGHHGLSAGIMVILRDSPSLPIVHLARITPDLRVKLSQTPPSPGMSQLQQSARPPISLEILSGDAPTKSKIELLVHARLSHETQRFVAEVRRLIEISEHSSRGVFESGWMGLYPVTSLAELDAPSGEKDGVSLELGTMAITPVDPDADGHPETTSLKSGQAKSVVGSGTDTDPFAPSFSRTDFLRGRIHAVQHEWSEMRPLKIRAVTYNVNDRLPPAGTLELADMAGEGDEDVLVFGFQELDLRSQALLLSQGASRADDWAAAIVRGLGEKGEAYERAMTQYVGVLMMVFVRRELRSAVADVQMSEKGIGLLGFGGNKAGVSVRLKIHDTTFCFVNSHLAAFANALERRRSDYATLRAGLSFSPILDSSGDGAVLDEFHHGGVRPRGLDECHVVVWMGDLNYRIDIPDDILSTWADEGRWAQIVEKDQLRLDILAGKSFAGFAEASIDFAPTYKYVHGTNDRDLRRAPAYTDRILWRAPPARYPSVVPASPPENVDRVEVLSEDDGPSQVSSSADTPRPAPSRAAPPLMPRSSSQRSFSLAPSPSASASASATASPGSITSGNPTPAASHPISCERYASHNLQWSDHRPVSATLRTQVRVVDGDKRSAALLAARNELGRLESVYRPNVRVEGAEIDFGEVRYRKQKSAMLSVENTGRVDATVAFKALGAAKDICKPFFEVFPPTVTLRPGEKAGLRVAVFVHEQSARRLTVGEDMNDVLVLQVLDGNDTFITLSAIFMPTIIGIPLGLLSLAPPPVPPATSGSAPRPPPKDADVSETALDAPGTSDDDFLAQAALASTPLPIRNVTLEERRARFGPARDSPGEKDPYAAPEMPGAVRPVREVWRLLEWLMDLGGGTSGCSQGLWGLGKGRLDGSGGEERGWDGGLGGVLDVIECLDTGADLPCYHSATKEQAANGEANEVDADTDAARNVSLALLHVFQALPEPLVPRRLARAYESAESREAAFGCLEGMRGVETNVLIGLMSVVKLCAAAAAAAVSSAKSHSRPTVQQGEGDGREQDDSGDVASTEVAGELSSGGGGVSDELVRVLADTIFGEVPVYRPPVSAASVSVSVSVSGVGLAGAGAGAGAGGATLRDRGGVRREGQARFVRLLLDG